MARDLSRTLLADDRDGGLGGGAAAEGPVFGAGLRALRLAANGLGGRGGRRLLACLGGLEQLRELDLAGMSGPAV